MLPADDIANRVRERPFVPLRIVTGSGQVYDIRHPELILVGRRSVTIGSASNENPTYYEQVSQVAILHITALENLPSSAPSNTNGPG
jgi:hypothetical protein